MLQHTLSPGGLVGFSTLDATFRSFFLLGTTRHVLPGSSFPVLLLVAEYPAEGGRGDMKPPTRPTAAIRAHHIKFSACYKISTAWHWILSYSSRKEGQTLAQGHCQGRHRGTAARQETTRLDKFLVVGGMEVLSRSLPDPSAPDLHKQCQTALETRRYFRSAVRSYYSSTQNDGFSPWK